MVLKTHINDREYDKFEDTVDGPAVRTTIFGGSFTGTFSPSGLQNGGLITEVTVNNLTWTALPLAPLTDRNAINIQNRSGQEVKLNYDNSEPGYVGVVVDDGGERAYDIKDSILIYAKSANSSCVLFIEEIS